MIIIVFLLILSDFKPCENGICEIVGDLYYKCLCRPSWTGINCHIGKEITFEFFYLITVLKDFFRIEIKPCGPETCLNGGKCKSFVTNDEADIGCDCPSNYTGLYCENRKFGSFVKN